MFNENSFDTGELNTAPPPSINIRPAQANDVEMILAMHQRLSADSIYKRYHSPRQPTRGEIEQICALSGKNGRVLAATIPGQTPLVVGMAYYVVTGQDAAETAFLVEDNYQGQGIGKRLVKHLKEQAVAQGIRFFDADVLSSNRPMIHLLRHAGQLVHNRTDYATSEIQVQLLPSSRSADETLHP